MNQKILFVENELLHDNPMSTCYVNKCNRIKTISNEFITIDYLNLNLTLTNIIQMDLTEYYGVLFGCRSLYLYKVYKGKEKEDLKQKFLTIINQIEKRFFIIQDMHQKTYGSIEVLSNLLNSNNFNIIFTFYENAEARLIRKLTPQCKYFHLPHHIDTNIFKNHLNLDNESKSIDILLFGSIHPRHYPFRKRLFDLILKHKNEFENIYHIEYDSTTFNPEHCEVGLSKLLNNSKICIGTKSRYDYLVGKYFEIASSKCLIAGDIPTDGRELLKDNILLLNDKMGDEEILEKLKNAINNYSNFSDQLENFKIKIDNEYNLDKYIEKLINILVS